MLGLEVDELVCCVQVQDIFILVKIFGVGKKIVECLLVELKDCFKVWENMFMIVLLVMEFCVSVIVLSVEVDVVSVLIVFGFKLQEVSCVVVVVLGEDLFSEEMICQVLKGMVQVVFDD